MQIRPVLKNDDTFNALTRQSFYPSQKPPVMLMIGRKYLVDNLFKDGREKKIKKKNKGKSTNCSKKIINNILCLAKL